MQFKIDNFTQEELEEARLIFSRPCTFVLGVAKLEQLPGDELNEIAFAGRSNVGKSSIINAVTGQNGLAKTSNTPGRTQQINFFNLDNKIHIVDLPGYGFAKAPENIVKQWQKLISTYLQGRSNLRRVFLLIDSRHGVKKVDDEIMKMLDKAAVTYQIVLTKTDKINQKDLEKVIESTKKVISEHTAAYARLIATSSAKNFGVEELRAEIVSLI
ncbi:MAG: ribosome biogenesis GTP-binding protein YihA/YsxC [Alphaproteobacteria bacterium]